jgi:nitrite reductase (NAD(P)H)
VSTKHHLLPHGLADTARYFSLHKRNYNLSTGDCLNDAEYKILAFSAREINGDISVLLPPAEDLDELIGSSKWMVRKATAAVFGKNLATALEIVGPDESPLRSSGETGGCQTGGGKLEW